MVGKRKGMYNMTGGDTERKGGGHKTKKIMKLVVRRNCKQRGGLFRLTGNEDESIWCAARGLGS